MKMVYGHFKDLFCSTSARTVHCIVVSGDAIGSVEGTSLHQETAWLQRRLGINSQVRQHQSSTSWSCGYVRQTDSHHSQMSLWEKAINVMSYGKNIEVLCPTAPNFQLSQLILAVPARFTAQGDGAQNPIKMEIEWYCTFALLFVFYFQFLGAEIISMICWRNFG